MRSLYTRMLNARLNEIAQKPDAPFIYAGAYYGSLTDVRLMYIHYQLLQKRISWIRVLNLILTENEKVRQFGFNASELERKRKIFFSL